MSVTLAASRKGTILEFAMEEILGPGGSTALLKSAGSAHGAGEAKGQEGGPPASVVQAVLEETYGPRAGCGLTMRIGRTCFISMLREFGAEVGLTDQAYKLLPHSVRMAKGSGLFAFLFMQLADCQVRQEVGDKTITWRIEPTPGKPGHGQKTPLCMLAAGFLQEAFSWMSGGKVFRVEAGCDPQGEGGACHVSIHKEPVSD